MKHIQVQSQPLNQSQTVNSQKIIIEPTKLTHCALVNAQKNSDKTYVDMWLLKLSNSRRAFYTISDDQIGLSAADIDKVELYETTKGFTELAIKLVYDDIMSKFELDSQTRFLYHSFNKNVLWYADCAVGVLSNWDEDITVNGDGYSELYWGYTQISLADLRYTFAVFKNLFKKYNDRVSKSLRTYWNGDLNKLKMPEIMISKPSYMENFDEGYASTEGGDVNYDGVIDAQEKANDEAVKVRAAELHLDAVFEWRYQNAVSEWTYDQLVGLMIIEHYSKSTEDGLFESVLNWIQFGAGDNYGTTLQTSAINIFKKSKESDMIKEVGEAFFYCYKP